MGLFIDTLRDRYCMNEESFTELEYRERLGALLEHTPNASAVRLNLPFQLISHHSQAATMILGNTVEALAQRSEESAPLRTLVVENLTDMTVVKLWRNPRDVKNIIDVFSGLEHLFLSMRRHGEGPTHAMLFRLRLWEMIGRAPGLRSLCLVGLDLDDKQQPPPSSRGNPSAPPPPPAAVVKTTTERDLTLDEWHHRSLPMMPTVPRPLQSDPPRLAYLELRRVEVMGPGLLSVLRYLGNSLRELYLDHVYLKTVYSAAAAADPDESDGPLWVGLPNVRPPRDHVWIAVYLRQMRARLRVCRASNLRYDRYVADANPAVPPVTALAYDLRDPSGLGRPLEQRFVEVVLSRRQPPAPDGSPVVYLSEHPADQDRDWDLDGTTPPPPPPPPVPQSPGNHDYHDDHDDDYADANANGTAAAPGEDEEEAGEHGEEREGAVGATAGTKGGAATPWWSAEHYLDNAPHPRNPTSAWQRNGIDGRFPNCNPFTLHELQHIADTALDGMGLVQILEVEGDGEGEGQTLAEMVAAGAGAGAGGGAGGDQGDD